MRRQIIGLICLTVVFAGGCAPMPTDETKQISHFKNDFSSGLNVVVDYVSDSRRTFIVVDIENPEEKEIQAWLVQRNTKGGQWTASGKRFYMGNSKIETATFRVPLGELGTTETFIVEVFDSAGGLLMQTEPIINTFQTEVTP